MATYDVKHYRTADGTDVFGEWFDALRDGSTQQRIAARIDRLAAGLFGDAKLLRKGVRELRIDFGPGYRVYFGIEGRTLIVLLCGGDKSTQRGDISRAARYWQDFRGTP